MPKCLSWRADRTGIDRIHRSGHEDNIRYIRFRNIPEAQNHRRITSGINHSRLNPDAACAAIED
jgi:hypothetical protein